MLISVKMLLEGDDWMDIKIILNGEEYDGIVNSDFSKIFVAIKGEGTIIDIIHMNEQGVKKLKENLCKE